MRLFLQISVLVGFTILGSCRTREGTASSEAKANPASSVEEEKLNELSTILPIGIFAGFNKVDENSGSNCYVEIVRNTDTQDGNRSYQVAVWNQFERDSYRLFSAYLNDGMSGPVTTSFEMRHKLGNGEAMHTVLATESSGDTTSEMQLTFFKKDSGEILSVAVKEGVQVTKCDLSNHKTHL
jgi:hypothetical protein